MAYSKEFKENAISLAGHLGVPKAARQLAIDPKGLRTWIKLGVDGGPVRPALGEGDEQLRLELKRMGSELRRLQEKTLNEEEIRRRIIGLTADVSALRSPGWILDPRSAESAPGVPTLFLSDFHWGEVVAGPQINNVNVYDQAIAQRRLRDLVPAALHLLKIISPKMQYPGLVLILGGDMISGNIHEELTATNEINSMPAVLDLFGGLIWVIDALLKRFPHIFIPCVTGNHGRDTKKIWHKDRHATSFDWLLYCFLAKHYADEKRITFQIPDGPDAYYKVYDHRYLLTHGDQFRGGDGMIGALGPILRGDHKKRSRNAQIDMEYDTLLMGHWHQYIHHSRVIVNGSLKGYDEYAYDGNFGFERPQQALWLTHPKYGLTYRMPVQVERLFTPAKTAWVSVAT